MMVGMVQGPLNFEELYKIYDPKVWMWLVSYSGGKDSSLLLALTLKFAENKGFKIHVVYNDSGGDLPEHRDLIYKVLKEVMSRGHAVHITSPSMTFFDYLLMKYSPPRWNFRWCCRRIKEIPFRKLIEGLSKEKPVLNLIGIRREEARWRNWEIKRVNERLVYVAPINNFTNDEVWQMLPSALSLINLEWVYDELKRIYNGAERSGCWFCPLIIHDKLLQSRPELLRLKLLIFNAWCSGNREEIIELSTRYPHLIKITVKSNINKEYPCGRRCSTCQILIVRKTLKLNIMENTI